MYNLLSSLFVPLLYILRPVTLNLNVVIGVSGISFEADVFRIELIKFKLHLILKSEEYIRRKTL